MKNFTSAPSLLVLDDDKKVTDNELIFIFARQVLFFEALKRSFYY
jgi:hypothetical protein